MRDFANVDAIDANGAMVDIIQAHDQVDQRGFADAGMTDNTNHLAGFDVEVDVFQDRFIRFVTKSHIVKGDAAMDLELPGVFAIFDIRFLIEDFENLGGTGRRVGKPAGNRGQPAQGTVQDDGVAGELDQLTELDFAAQDLITAEIEDQKLTQTDGKSDQREEQCPGLFIAGAGHSVISGNTPEFEDF